MKKLLLISFLFPYCILYSQSQDFSIVGTWKQVSFESIKNGNSVSYHTNRVDAEQLKSWSKEYFLFVGKTLNNNHASYVYGNGNYSLHGNHYTEMINVHVSPAIEGMELKIYMELNGDTLTQVFPVKNDWSYDIENCWIEKFVEVE
ncbi:MAG: hypothetical protein DRR42_10855 [Gammaproteobacteria bacterium]|nr:MAG: hypothetical protein DRR42_10855 [Gammaproteobacteria bacterium]